MSKATAHAFRFEPTVFGAVRRYATMVLTSTVLAGMLAVAQWVINPQDYRATAKVTVPRPLLLAGQGSDQYLDSQVLLLQSQEVTERAAEIANEQLGERVLNELHFVPGEGERLVVTPPQGSTPGAYGANTITVSFRWPDAGTARTAANALLHAYDEYRSAAIRAEVAATVREIDEAIADAQTGAQVRTLSNRRTQVVLDRQVDLSRRPTVVWASEPLSRVNGGPLRGGAIGAFVGLVLGAALAYARQRRHRCFDDVNEPAALYGAPLILEVPCTSGKRTAPVVMSTAPASDGAEAYRFAAESVERLRAGDAPSLCLSVVSALPSACRSVNVANLALALAESGRRVLVVDADMTTGHLTRLLLPDSPSVDGLQQVLALEATAQDCILETPWSDSAAILPAGRPDPHRATGSTYASAVTGLLNEVKKQFEIVLIDAPAFLRVVDATRLINASDAVIVVVGSEEPVKHHLDMVDHLEQIEAHVVGYIYNRVRSGVRLSRRSSTSSLQPPRHQHRIKTSHVPSGRSPLGVGSVPGLREDRQRDPEDA